MCIEFNSTGSHPILLFVWIDSPHQGKVQIEPASAFESARPKPGPGSSAMSGQNEAGLISEDLPEEENCGWAHVHLEYT